MQEFAYFCTAIITIWEVTGIKTAYIPQYFHRCGIAFVLLVFFVSCSTKENERVVAPWGEVGDSAETAGDFDLDMITANGEMIMLTLTGPATYYDYRGRHLGLQYMLCQRFADKTGVRLRVDVCRDTLEMVRRLLAGDGDVIACQLAVKSLRLPADSLAELVQCGPKTDSLGTGWLVSRDKPQLAGEIDAWYKPALLSEVEREEAYLLSSRSVKRHVFSPMLNRSKGVISRYDGLFAAHCRPIRWDWRLMAAQCYQESTFDPQAKSWAGACGLMQIMPGTAKDMGLPMDRIYDPESNIAAAAKLLGQLNAKFGDILAHGERTKFVLAAYNGGYHHIRDAMALAQRDGRSPHRWSDVSHYVLLLSEPRYYNDPLVKYGYMRGTETVDYVDRIYRRWQSYRGVKSAHTGFSGMEPQKATRTKSKYKLQVP